MKNICGYLQLTVKGEYLIIRDEPFGKNELVYIQNTNDVGYVKDSEDSDVFKIIANSNLIPKEITTLHNVGDFVNFNIYSMKILRMSFTLTKEEFKSSIREYECKETKGLFIVDKESSFGGKSTRIKKEDILRVDSMMRTDIFDTIHAYTWYFDGQENQAKTLLTERLTKELSKRKNAVDEMLKHKIV